VDGPLTQPAVTLPVARCSACSLTCFPPTAAGCARCGGHDLVEDSLPGYGRVWTYTVQRFPPKSPPYVLPADGFVPYVVAYVEMDGGLRVGGIVEGSHAAVTIGTPVELTGVDDVPRFRIATEGA